MMETVNAQITDFLSRGSKEEVLLKKIAAIGLVMIVIYRLCNIAGVAICHIVY
ncbi:hypothetical protein [Butyrivibrio sp. WCE2006]|uniref:hypothetical protein n=1 Tax=Butyrivibrio sp. WCE2006 TaxID=1410611 RepID=UPI000A67A38E|nr:hypothetical protein [Butyrivibrio sp. WCE2006]